MTSLRQRIRKYKINCVPWKRYKYEIQRLPISAQCLFSKKGLSYDVLEMELLEEGWLLPGETLFEVLYDPKNLKRKIRFEFDEDEYTKDWTDEDYIWYYERKN